MYREYDRVHNSFVIELIIAVCLVALFSLGSKLMMNHRIKSGEVQVYRDDAVLIGDYTEYIENEFKGIIGKYNKIFDYRNEMFYIMSNGSVSPPVNGKNVMLPDTFKSISNADTHEVLVELNKDTAELIAKAVRKIE